MQDADHNLLSNGQDFVWVKDASTLATVKYWIELGLALDALPCRLAIAAEGQTTETINTAANMDGNWNDLNDYRVMQPMKGISVLSVKGD